MSVALRKYQSQRLKEIRYYLTIRKANRIWCEMVCGVTRIIAAMAQTQGRVLVLTAEPANLAPRLTELLGEQVSAADPEARVFCTDQAPHSNWSLIIEHGEARTTQTAPRIVFSREKSPIEIAVTPYRIADACADGRLSDYTLWTQPNTINKKASIVQLIAQKSWTKVAVYCTSQQDSEQFSAELNKAGVRAGQAEDQAAFSQGELAALCVHGNTILTARVCIFIEPQSTKQAQARIAAALSIYNENPAHIIMPAKGEPLYAAYQRLLARRPAPAPALNMLANLAARIEPLDPLANVAKPIADAGRSDLMKLYQRVEPLPFQQMLNVLQNYIAKYGKIPPTAASHRGMPLGRWVELQCFKRQTGHLKPRHQAALTAVPNWCWSPPTTKQTPVGVRGCSAYDLKAIELSAKCIAEYGKIPKQSMVYENFKLGAWIKLQRRHYRAKTINPYIESELEKNPGWFWVKFHRQIEDKYLLYRQYAREFSAQPGPNTLYEGFQLGQWFHHKKQNFSRQKQREKLKLVKLPYWNSEK